MLTSPDPILGKRRPTRTAMSTAEKKALAKEKRARLKQAREAAELEGWRDINPKLECFEMKPIDNLAEFLTLRIRNGFSKPIDIFKLFLDDEVLDYLINRFPEMGLHFSLRNRRLKDGNRSLSARRMTLSYRDALQVQAYYIRVIAHQCHDPGLPYYHFGNIRDALHESKEYFQQLCPANCNAINIDKARRILAHLTLDGNESMNLISKKFQSVVLTLGQCIAGDENLFTFHGMSGNVRLVPSKPGKLGLWFYELCARFKSGVPFLLDSYMHDLRDGTIKVSSINRRWIRVIKTT